MRPRFVHAILESLRVQFDKALQRLLDAVQAKQATGDGLDNLRRALESLPLSSEEFATAVNHLDNAGRYLAAGECGAARFELRLLRSLTGLRLSDGKEA
jgi:hypothetical protein